jgi:hypothetical protein
MATVDIDRARAALDSGGGAGVQHGAGELTGFFSRRHYGYGMRGHLDSVHALVHSLAGEVDDADRVFGLVQRHAANGRRRAASYAHQALGYTAVATADAEAACAALLASIDLARSEHYAMGLRRCAGVRARFDPAWSRLACVRAVDEHLRPAPAW